MINCKVKLKPAELKAIALVSSHLNMTDHDIDWRDFYNIRSLTKRILDRLYKTSVARERPVSVSININEYESLLHVYSFNEKFFLEKIYESVIFSELFSQMDKQVQSLKLEKMLLKGHEEEKMALLEAI